MFSKFADVNFGVCLFGALRVFTEQFLAYNMLQWLENNNKKHKNYMIYFSLSRCRNTYLYHGLHIFISSFSAAFELPSDTAAFAELRIPIQLQ